ncbi:hypothetical protein P4639_14630 [Priestia megaterium]|uniref:hypothetical protein n=1 Tax=Priestia megaterium TaxID=1404 RepID=UPI002E1D5F36|nr:hypothetical protein [Priestia megaterium]
MLKKVYFLHLNSNNFSRKTIKYDEKPTEKEIEKQIIKYNFIGAELHEGYEVVKVSSKD